MNIKDYNEEWVNIFKAEKKNILDNINYKIIDIQHIGSTAVLGLAANPIVDIGVLVPSLDESEKYINAFEQLGFEYQQKRSSVERCFFTKNNPPTIHLSIAEPERYSFWKRQIFFRDYLTTHKEEAKKYEAIKRDLIKQHPDGRQEYCDGKSDFINRILKLADTKIIIRAQTVDEEFDYLMNVFSKMDFYNEHGYTIPVPDHSYFINISNNLKLLESLNMDEAKAVFKEKVYSLDYFEKGLELIKKDVDLIEKAVARMEKWKLSGFKIFNNYTLKLTAYGPGGSYNYRKGSIIMKTKEDGSFGKHLPLSTVIHEIIHIGIEESIVQKFELTHLEKEGLVDAICVNYFDDIMVNYQPQARGDKKLFNLVGKNNIEDLPEIIKEFKKNHLK